MRITVIIPSRRRVRGLNCALTTLDRLASGNHEITYAIACDNDDPHTQSFCLEMQKELPIVYRVGPRPKALGTLVNKMAELVPGDLYFALCDDMLCLTPNWDEVAARAATQTPHGVFFWTNVFMAQGIDALWPIVTEKWRAAAGCIYTDHYPFWYDDLALVEQYALTTGEHIQRLPIIAMDKPGATHRMRELPFWNEFFLFTRKWRIERGKEIAANIGLPEPVIGEALVTLLDKEWCKPPRDYLERIEANQGDKSPRTKTT